MRRADSAEESRREREDAGTRSGRARGLLKLTPVDRVPTCPLGSFGTFCGVGFLLKCNSRCGRNFQIAKRACSAHAGVCFAVLSPQTRFGLLLSW